MRSKNSILNILGTLGSYFMVLIFNFITQGVLIRKLGIEYSGINGLFTNILTMLSIAELGIGTTIIFKLYKPIADNDVEQIKSWMKFYKVCYRYVALFVTIAGCILIPFVPNIVGEVTVPENILILYGISLLDIIFSYIMTYKRSLLYADQKNYLINFVHMGYALFMNLTQIIIISLTKNYIAFLVVKVIYRVLENVIINIIVDKKYKFIKEKALSISKEERKDVLKRIRALFLQKISFVINKGIDNIIISMCLGIIAVGYYTNYNLIVTTLSTLIYQVVSSMTASVGNLLTENNSEKSYAIYRKINMFNSFVTGLCVVGFGCVISPFICVWVGEKYVLDVYILISFSIYLYTDSIRRSITLYKEAAGICKEDQLMYVFMAIINLVTSIVLCNFIGIAGVILGTAISYLFLIIYSYPKYIFKPLFKKRYREYFKENAKYLLFIIISFTISYLLCRFSYTNSFVVQVILNTCIVLAITLLVFWLMFRKTEEFKYYIEMIKAIKNKIIKTEKEKE